MIVDDGGNCDAMMLLLLLTMMLLLLLLLVLYLFRLSSRGGPADALKTRREHGANTDMK